MTDQEKQKLIVVPEEHPDKYKEMPSGLDGYWWETSKVICVPFVENLNEGDGSFSKWLTELESKNKIVFFPTIVSARLDFIL